MALSIIYFILGTDDESYFNDSYYMTHQHMIDQHLERKGMKRLLFAVNQGHSINVTQIRWKVSFHATEYLLFLVYLTGNPNES